MAKLAAVSGILQVEVMDFPIPEPMDDGLVIKMEVAAICGTDVRILNAPNRKTPGNMGHEFCGKIVSMGARAKESVICMNGTLEVGDRIAVYPWITCGTCGGCLRFGEGHCGVCEAGFFYGGSDQYLNETLNHQPEKYPHFKGGFGEYCPVFAKTYVWKVPDDMPSKIAVLLDPMAVAVRAVEQAMTGMGSLQEGLSTTSHCLVIGPGPIGVMVAIILRTMGVEQVAISGRRDQKLALAQEISGAHVTINVGGLTLEEKIAKVNEKMGGAPDVVINCANHPDSCIEGLQMVRTLGTYVEIGNAMDAIGVVSEVNIPTVVFSKNAYITSVMVNSPKSFDRAFRLLQRHHEIPFDKIVTHEFFALEDLVPTIQKNGDPDYLKGVLVFPDAQ